MSMTYMTMVLFCYSYHFSPKLASFAPVNSANLLIDQDVRGTNVPAPFMLACSPVVSLFMSDPASGTKKPPTQYPTHAPPMGLPGNFAIEDLLEPWAALDVAGGWGLATVHLCSSNDAPHSSAKCLVAAALLNTKCSRASSSFMQGLQHLVA